MAQPVTIGIDVGTSGLKGLVVSADGTAPLEASAAYPLLTPREGWTEQDPAGWLRAAREVLRELAGGLRARGLEAAALGLSGQMHGMVALDARGEVVRPAPLWNDQRTGAAVAEIERAVPRAELVRRTGNPAVTGFQLPKLVWLRAAEPEAFARVRHVLLPKDYVGFALTGRLATEPSDASGVGALNLGTLGWDADVLGALGLDAGLFPEVVPSHSVVGGLSAEWARGTGLPEGLPVVAGAGDNAGAAVGLGVSSARPGAGSVSLGTSGVVFVPVERPQPEPGGRVHLFAHADGGYHLLGVTLAAAGSLQWLRDRLAPDAGFDELLAEAATVPAGSGGLVFLPYLAGERSPQLDPDLRGGWLGLGLAHSRAHLVRALLEGTAFGLADALEAMRPLARPQRLLATGGGSRSGLWLGLVGNALGVPLERPEREQGPARGAAVLAAVGAGLHASLPEALERTVARATPVQVVPEPALEAARERFRRASALASSFAHPA